MKATRDNVKVGTILIHRCDESECWFAGRKVRLTKIHNDWYRYETIGDCRNSPDSINPELNEFIWTGLKDFDIFEEQPKPVDDAEAIGKKFLRLKEIHEQVLKLKEEELQLKSELGLPWLS